MARRLLPLAALLAAPLCQAQFSGTFPSATSSSGSFSALGPGSAQPVLVDPKRLHTSQSVTFSAMSGGGGSYSQSLVQNRIDYRLWDPLTLHLDLGILTPLQASGTAAQGMQKGAYLIPDVGLEYRPSESVLFALRYVSVPSAPLGSPGGLPWR
jgi:hypothetical protein